MFKFKYLYNYPTMISVSMLGFWSGILVTNIGEVSDSE
jgi:hypothetical protein